MDEKTFLYGVDELQRAYPGQEYSPNDKRNLKKHIFAYYHPKAEEWKECLDDLIGSETFLPRVAKVKETFAAIRKRQSKPMKHEGCQYCGNEETGLGWVRYMPEDGPSIVLPCVCNNRPRWAKHLKTWRVLQKEGKVKLEQLRNDITHKRLSYLDESPRKEGCDAS